MNEEQDDTVYVSLSYFSTTLCQIQNSNYRNADRIVRKLASKCVRISANGTPSLRLGADSESGVSCSMARPEYKKSTS